MRGKIGVRDNVKRLEESFNRITQITCSGCSTVSSQGLCLYLVKCVYSLSTSSKTEFDDCLLVFISLEWSLFPQERAAFLKLLCYVALQKLILD